MPEYQTASQAHPFQSRSHSLAWLSVIPILLLAAWLGIRGLDADALWYDELLAVFRAGSEQYGEPLSLTEVWNRTTSVGNYQNPGYYMALSVWGGQVGFSELGGRSLSLLAGLITVAWTYRLGRDIGGWRVGWIAASVLASSAFFVEYLHEMRAYSLYLMMTVIAIWAYWRVAVAAPRQPHRWARLMLVLSAAGMLYMHYFAMLTLAAIGAHHVLFVRKDRRWWIVTGLLVVVGLTYIPWIAQSLDAVNDTSMDEGRKASAMSIRTTTEMLATTFSNNGIVFYGFISISAILTARWRRPDVLRRCDLLPWTLVIGIFVLGIAVNEWLDVLIHIRYLIALWIPLALLVAFGMDRLAQRGVSLALLSGIWITVGLLATFDTAFIPSIYGTFEHLPFRELAQTVTQRGQDDDVVVLHVPDFNWLREPTFKHYMDDTPGQHTLMESLVGLPGEEYDTSARNFIDGAPRVWLAVDQTLPPTFRLEAFERVLAHDDYVHCQSVFDLDTMRLDLYTRIPDEVTLRFGGETDDEAIGVTLLEPLPEWVSGEGNLATLIGWTIGAAVPENAYSVGLHVIAADGRSVGQVDHALPVTAFSCGSDTIALDKLAPGTYSLIVVVYDWQTGERLHGAALATGQQGDMLTLGSFNVR